MIKDKVMDYNKYMQVPFQLIMNLLSVILRGMGARKMFEKEVKLGEMLPL
jgi:hypothetical protein